jgi:hypothetical protein
MANAVPTAGNFPKKHSKREAKVIETALAGVPVATVIAAIGSTSNLVAPAEIGDAAPLAGTETRLDAIEAKVDALIAALKTAGLMATS